MFQKAMTPLCLPLSLVFLHQQVEVFHLVLFAPVDKRVFKRLNNSREECIDLSQRAAVGEIDSYGQSQPEGPPALRRGCWMIPALRSEITAEPVMFRCGKSQGCNRL